MRWLACLILPYTRRELPGWGRLFRLLRVGGGENDALWRGAPTRVIRDKRTRQLLKLDLADWSERHTYFLGRYYDLPLQLLMAAVLRPGDRFVDVGANIGMTTLYGAALVGAAGRVDSFEPNPECAARVAESLALNAISHVALHQAALADAPATMTLSVITAHTGMATLAAPEAEQRPLVSRTLAVPVVTGDEILLREPRPVRLVKIDVEGFELRALKGLAGCLHAWRPIVVTEMQRDWLRRAGTSRGEVFDWMRGHGYAPYGLRTRRRLLRHRLALVPLTQGQVEAAGFDDFVWLHAATSGLDGLRGFIRT